MALAYKKLALAEDTTKGRINTETTDLTNFLTLGTNILDGSVAIFMCRAATSIQLYFGTNYVQDILSLEAGMIYTLYFNTASNNSLNVDIYSSSGLISIEASGTALKLAGQNGELEYIIFK